MTKKDETPNTTPPNGNMKRFIIGLLGGLIGGAIVLIVFYTFSQGSFSSGNNPLVTQDTKGDTKVSNIKYDVDSSTTKAVEKVQEAVVSVQNLKTRQTGSYGDLNDLFGEDNSNSSSASEGEAEVSGEGSGVIYKKSGDKAYVVTNNHVVEGSDSLEVILNDGSKVSAKLVGADVTADLAVLEIDASVVKTVAEFGDSEALKTGEPAIAIGSPLGSEYANSVTQGIISAKNRVINNESETGATVNINAIQTDAAINPGNSGGPLVNATGQVIGINSIKFAQTPQNGIAVEGMGFAIPSNDVVKIINQLEKGQKVVRPMLGIAMQPLTSISAQSIQEDLKLPSEVKEGVALTKVAENSPAGNAGLRKYDVITEIDGKAIKTAAELQSALYQKNIGDKMEITYYREKEKKTTTVELTQDDSNLRTQ